MEKAFFSARYSFGDKQRHAMSVRIPAVVGSRLVTWSDDGRVAKAGNAITQICLLPSGRTIVSDSGGFTRHYPEDYIYPVPLGQMKHSVRKDAVLSQQVESEMLRLGLLERADLGHPDYDLAEVLEAYHYHGDKVIDASKRATKTLLKALEDDRRDYNRELDDERFEEDLRRRQALWRKVEQPKVAADLFQLIIDQKSCKCRD